MSERRVFCETQLIRAQAMRAMWIFFYLCRVSTDPVALRVFIYLLDVIRTVHTGERVLLSSQRNYPTANLWIRAVAFPKFALPLHNSDHAASFAFSWRLCLQDVVYRDNRCSWLRSWQTYDVQQAAAVIMR